MNVCSCFCIDSIWQAGLGVFTIQDEFIYLGCSNSRNSVKWCIRHDCFFWRACLDRACPTFEGSRYLLAWIPRFILKLILEQDKNFPWRISIWSSNNPSAEFCICTNGPPYVFDGQRVSKKGKAGLQKKGKYGLQVTWTLILMVVLCKIAGHNGVN